MCLGKGQTRRGVYICINTRLHAVSNVDERWLPVKKVFFLDEEKIFYSYQLSTTLVQINFQTWSRHGVCTLPHLPNSHTHTQLPRQRSEVRAGDSEREIERERGRDGEMWDVLHYRKYTVDYWGVSRTAYANTPLVWTDATESHYTPLFLLLFSHSTNLPQSILEIAPWKCSHGKTPVFAFFLSPCSFLCPTVSSPSSSSSLSALSPPVSSLCPRCISDHAFSCITSKVGSVSEVLIAR